MKKTKKKVMTFPIIKTGSGSTHNPADRRSGFTLVEILIVMVIIGILAGMILVAMGSIQKKAKDEATISLVARLNLQIADYYRKKGSLPEDGFDTSFKVGGKSLEGGAALYHQLTNDVYEMTFIAGEMQEKKHQPVAKYENSDLTTDEDTDIVYIIDAHGDRIHYDNLTIRPDPPKTETEAGPDSSYGRFSFTVGVDSHYEIWSIGMRDAADENDLKIEDDSSEDMDESDNES